MAQMTNFLVKDDAATPVVLTLVPITDTPVPFWRANIANVPIEGQPRLTFTQEKQKTGDYRLTAKLEVPVMETLGASGTSAGYVAPPKVAYTTVCIFTMFANRRSTSQDRANALRMIVGILQGAGATVDTGILKNNDLGNVFLNSSAAGPQSFVSLVLPN